MRFDRCVSLTTNYYYYYYYYFLALAATYAKMSKRLRLRSALGPMRSS